MMPNQLLKKVFPPMLATLAEAPPRDDANWTYELKYDGFRAITAITAEGIAMLSRNEIDLAPRFPHTYEALHKVKAKEIVIDGEVVVLDEEGNARFQLLQQGGEERLVLFDILWMDGKDLRRLPYVERRKLLEKTFKKAPKGIALAQVLEMSGDDALAHAASKGLEGVIAKRKTSVYETRRSKEWLKIKAMNEQEFVIVGWQPSNVTDREIGSLHLGVNENGVLRYAGKVGTGFSAKLRVELRNQLAKDVVPKPLVEDAPREKKAIWTKPRLIAQVSFAEWTSDHRLRHPSFLGLRDDKRVEAVVKEKAAPPASKVNFTNLDRMIYPKDNITKKDVIAYYEAMAEPMLRALKDRPLALEHWNQGITKPAWFHQSIGKEGPSWLRVVDTPTRTTKSGVARHLVVDSVDALRWLGQMSALTVHMWSSREGSLEEPDWMLFDLDPAKGKGIEQAIDAAIVMRGLLENLELPAVAKTSGKRGIHVFVPLVSGYTHEQVAEFAFAIGGAVASKVPGITVERTISKRRGRLYLDCLQNGYGKTVVAPYTLRAIDGAPVSAPLKWDEITKKLDPMKFNLRTMPDRLAKVGDLFAEVFKKRVKLPKLG